MSSTEQTPSPPAQQQQQPPRVRKPPFSDWPTIKILNPPQGRFSPKTDEWCFTYCSQTITGRIHNKEPNCHSICLRKVFPHEVRNLVSFKRHTNVGADGKAKYPLPAEGQSANIPRYLGGSPKEAEDRTPSASGSTKYWDEGWYLWAGKGRWAALQKTENMMLDFQRQQQLEVVRQSRKEVWQKSQEQLQNNVGVQSSDGKLPQPPQWWRAPIFPPKALQDDSDLSLLIPLPPDFPPFWDRINNLLAPTHQALGILHESLASGEQLQFAQRVWEKARTDEPFVLAQRTFSRIYEQWKKHDVPDEDDPKKGPT